MLKTRKVALARIAPLVLLVLLAATQPASAATPLEESADKVVDLLTGGLARSVAVIAVVALGYLALTGRIHWRSAVSVIVGITLIFSAAAIVDIFTRT